MQNSTFQAVLHIFHMQIMVYFKAISYLLLKEKMQYLNSNFPKDEQGQLPGQVHYENLCMKAVNQSIGRAIRHRNDYATILLLDKRYCRESVRGKLPAWIAKDMQKMDKYGPSIAAISKFFQGKRSTL